MDILGCAVGPISIEKAVITPLSGGRADTSTCTFDFDPNQTSLVNDILSDIESIP